MDRLPLVFVLHCHQPVGNLDDVFSRAVDMCYAPLLEALRAHPGVRMGLHFSGCLLEWLEDRRPGLLDRLSELARREQVELLGGGFYEPLLPLIPEDDARGQLALMNDHLARRFGKKPRGAWLGERLWSPELARLLARAGLEYTLVDDIHFPAAAAPGESARGTFVTEHQGRSLSLIPIARELRQAIPFQPVPEVLRLLQEAARGDGGCLCYADDGEKFGLWPGTHEWVFGKGWLDEFFAALQSSASVEMLTPSACLERFPPRRRVYPLPGGHEELLSGSLPAPERERLEKLRRKLEGAGLWAEVQPWLRSGRMEDFFVKYPEANHLHKKMLHVSRKLKRALADGMAPDRVEPARRALYRAQCGCVYWHGWFGGLYLPHLRDRAYRELVGAEDILDRASQGSGEWIAFEPLDFDGDGREELVAENAALSLVLDPPRGGTLAELDFRPARLNLTHLVSRHPESYHALPEAGADEDDPEGERALFLRFRPDRFLRRCLCDRFPQPESSLEEMLRGTYVEEGDFGDGEFETRQAGIDEAGDCSFSATLSRTGRLLQAGAERRLRLEKQIVLPMDRAEIEVRYRLQNLDSQPLSLLFAPEFCLRLPGAGQDGCRIETGALSGPGPRLRGAGDLPAAEALEIFDERENVRLRFEFQPAAPVWHHPVETITRTESGLGPITQGHALLPRFRMHLEPGGEARVALRLSIASGESEAVVPWTDGASPPHPESEPSR
jgi:alpha-amylase